MSTAARLRAALPEICAVLKRTRRAWAPDVVEFLELALEASRGRGEGAARVSGERSALTRGRIRAVVGALPLSQPMHELVAVVRQRLDGRGWSAGKWTIEDELRVLRKEASESEPRPTAIRAKVRSSLVHEKGVS